MYRGETFVHTQLCHAPESSGIYTCTDEEAPHKDGEDQTHGVDGTWEVIRVG